MLTRRQPMKNVGAIQIRRAARLLGLAVDVPGPHRDAGNRTALNVDDLSADDCCLGVEGEIDPADVTARTDLDGLDVVAVAGAARALDTWPCLRDVARVRQGAHRVGPWCHTANPEAADLVRARGVGDGRRVAGGDCHGHAGQRLAGHRVADPAADRRTRAQGEMKPRDVDRAARPGLGNHDRSAQLEAAEAAVARDTRVELRHQIAHRLGDRLRVEAVGVGIVGVDEVGTRRQGEGSPAAVAVHHADALGDAAAVEDADAGLERWSARRRAHLARKHRATIQVTG
jgi:hypothetical protein